MSRNAALNAVVAMLRSRMAGEPATNLPPWPADPAEIVAAASAHFVLPALHEAVVDGAGQLPEDLMAFLAEIAGANRVRNAALRRALWKIAAALNAIGVTPLVLKGGAFLADPAAEDAGWRFMSDLDLLVEEPRLQDCVRAVAALGFKAVREDYEPEHEAHFPPLLSPCRTFSIELHTRLFAVHEIAAPVSAWLAEAGTLDDGRGARLLIPSPGHRLAHLVAHAQIHNRFHMMRRVVLRDLLDFGALLAAHGEAIAWRQVLAAFPGRRERDAALSFLAAWSRIVGRRSPVALSARHRRWAAAALGRLSRPVWQRRLLVATDLIRGEGLRLAHEHGHLKRRLALLNPRRLAQTAAAWRHKLAQRLWA